MFLPLSRVNEQVSSTRRMTTPLQSKLVLSLAVLMSTNLVGCAESLPKQANRTGFNDSDKAEITKFSTAISQDPNHAEYYYARGRAYVQLGNYTAAISDFNKVLELAPKFANAYYHRAEVYSRLERYQDAIVDANLVLEMYPHEASAYKELIQDYQHLGRDKKVLELSLLNAKEVPEESASFEQVYDAATKVHDQEKRLWACDQLVRFGSSKYHNPWHCRGIVLYEQRKYKQAIENFSTAIKRSGFPDDCVYQRGLAKAALNQNAEAFADFDQATKLRATKSHLGARGVAAYFLGRYDDAIRDLSSAISQDAVSIYRGYYKYRAMAYDKKGLKDLATKDRASYAKMRTPDPQTKDPLPPNWSFEVSRVEDQSNVRDATGTKSEPVSHLKKR